MKKLLVLTVLLNCELSSADEPNELNKDQDLSEQAQTIIEEWKKCIDDCVQASQKTNCDDSSTVKERFDCRMNKFRNNEDCFISCSKIENEKMRELINKKLNQ